MDTNWTDKGIKLSDLLSFKMCVTIRIIKANESLTTVYTAIGFCHAIYVDCLLAVDLSKTYRVLC